jgi:hypothetical protein
VALQYLIQLWCTAVGFQVPRAEGKVPAASQLFKQTRVLGTIPVSLAKYQGQYANYRFDGKCSAPCPLLIRRSERFAITPDTKPSFLATA